MAHIELDREHLTPRLALDRPGPSARAHVFPAQHTWRRHGIFSARSYPPPSGGVGPAAVAAATSLFVVGGVGSGKTTYVETLARQHQATGGGVIWLSPASLAAGGDGAPGSGTATDGDPSASAAPGGSRTWILVDGVTAADPLEAMLGHVRRRFPGHRLVLAARAGDAVAASQGFQVVHVLPWSPAMLEVWLARHCRRGAGQRGVLAAAFKRLLDQDPELPLTPLLVRLLADRARRRVGAAGCDGGIYEAYVRHLLRRRTRPGDPFALIAEDVQLDMLSILCAQEGIIRPEVAQQDLRRWLPRVGGTPEAASLVLSDLGLGSGILGPGEAGLAFVCRGVHQYLTHRWRRLTGRAPALEATGRVPTVDAPADVLGQGLGARAFALAVGAKSLAAEQRRRYQAVLLRHYWTGSWDDVQQQALAALGWIADETVVRHLDQALGCASVHLRVRAAQALCRLGGDRAARLLHRALADGSWKVRIHAAEGVGRWGGTSAWPDLAARLRDGHWQVRVAAAEALGWLGDEAAVPALAAALSTGYRSSQHASSAVFRRWGLGLASDLTLKAADDQDLAVRQRTAEALVRIGTPAALQALERVEAPGARLATAAVVAKSGRPEALPVLRAGLTDPSAAQRYRAALASAYVPFVCGLDYQPDERAALVPLAPLLADRLGDEAWPVRGVAAVALGSLGRPDLAEPVLGLLDDADHFVSTNAAVALGMAGCTRAGPALLAVLADPDRPETTRAYAGRALGSLGVAAAVPALSAALDSGGILLRQKAARALGDVGGVEVLEVLLVRALEDDEPAVRDAAFGAAARLCRRCDISLEGGPEWKRGKARPVIDTIALIQRYV